MNLIMIISYLKDQRKKDYIKKLKEIYKADIDFPTEDDEHKKLDMINNCCEGFHSF